MKFKLACCSCGCTYWRKGSDDPEVNAYTITDEEGDFCPDCGGDNYIVVDQEDDSPTFDDLRAWGEI